MAVRLIDNTVKTKAQIHEGLVRGINSAGRFWVSEAKDLAPVDTGFLKAHIGQTYGASANNLSTEVRSLAPYSGSVNYGTSKQPAQPFWTVAGLLTRQKFAWLIKQGVSIGKAASAGPGIIRSALENFHGPMGRKGGGF